MLRSPDLGKLLSMRDDPLPWSCPWFAGSIHGLSVAPVAPSPGLETECMGK